MIHAQKETSCDFGYLTTPKKLEVKCLKYRSKMS
jgi:hypothetical protein